MAERDDTTRRTDIGEELGPLDEVRMNTGADDRSRSLEPTDRRRVLDPAYAGPERRLASRR